jgi:hypothetical protein
MENMNYIIEELLEDIDTPDDAPVMYEVWAVGYDEEEHITDAELLIGTFDDPDEAVCFAKSTTEADILNLAEDEGYSGFAELAFTIHVEVETVVASEEDGIINIGTIYKKTIDLSEETPDLVCLSNDEYTIIEETGYIQIPQHIVKKYDEGDKITVLFEEEEKPWPIEYKIISKTEDYYICDFV